LRIVALREIPDDRLLRDQWDALVDRMERPEVFYTYEWALAVQRAYGLIARPLILLGYDDAALIGVAALAVEQNGNVSFLAGTTADYCDFVSLPELRQMWCEAIFFELRKSGYSSLTLPNLPADSATACALAESARGHGYRTFIRPAYRCARIVLGNSSEDRESLRRRITAKRGLRRGLNSANKQAPTVFEIHVSEERVAQAVAELCNAHVTRFLLTGRFSNNIRIFLQELARELSKRGWLSISRLLVGDRCVAWNYGFQFAGSWLLYQATFDTQYEHFSPGSCLLGKIIEAACDRPEISVVDLGLGAEGYKEKFATDTRQTVHATLDVATVRHARTVLRYHAAELIKARPKAEARVRAAMNRLTRLKSHVQGQGLWASASHIASRVRDSVVGRDEAHFFQWCGTDDIGPQYDSLDVREADPNLLGLAAIEYADDKETLDYLLRAVRRLRARAERGFALVTSTGKPLHFCWASDFENFELQELEQQLTVPSPNAVLLFDCWTPGKLRGRNHFATGIALVSRRLWSSGEVPWIFGAARDYPSLKGIAKAGFTYKFTMGRRRFLGLTQTVKMVHKPIASLAPVRGTLRDYAPSEN
jgi:CelD/BcsL family acetyltransferase involved in cellulose biosynthesis